ncbi:hypothetical protein [Embleya sp. NPDC050493]|uniref:hypothetical protein n=1 Tax=Embleya sp. NPDC050493 TaxID=3363989 RepID=UPI00378B0D18
MHNGLNWSLLLDGPKLPGDPIAALQGNRPEAERAEALQQLADAAAPGDSSAVNQYAAALLAFGRKDDAERVWRTLIERRPDFAYAYLNLATSHLMAGRAEECARTLEACRGRTGIDTQERQLVERRIAELEDARQDTARQVRYLELRVAAIRERFERGLASAEELKELARLLSSLVQVPGSGVTSRDFLAAARQVRRAAADDPDALEILAAALIAAEGFSPEFNDVLLELERVAPHSTLLATVREWHTDPMQAQHAESRAQRLREVGRRAFAGDRNAVEELRLEVQRSPTNHDYRFDLVSAVYHMGDYAEARRLTDEWATDPSADHLVHFHVAQFYWILGAQELSRHHFGRAYATAADETDREDVRLAMRTVGAGDPADLDRG